MDKIYQQNNIKFDLSATTMTLIKFQEHGIRILTVTTIMQSLKDLTQIVSHTRTKSKCQITHIKNEGKKGTTTCPHFFKFSTDL